MFSSGLNWSKLVGFAPSLIEEFKQKNSLLKRRDGNRGTRAERRPGVKGRAHRGIPPRAAGRVGPGAVHSADIRSHPKGHHQRREHGHGHLSLLLPAIGPRRVQAAGPPLRAAPVAERRPSHSSISEECEHYIYVAPSALPGPLAPNRPTARCQPRTPALVRRVRSLTEYGGDAHVGGGA